MRKSLSRSAKHGSLAAIIIASGTMAPPLISPVQAQTAPLVDVCTGISVDDSVLRGILNTTVVPTATGVEALYDVLLPKSLVGIPLLGSLTDVNLGIASTTSAIASGDLIGVTLLDTDGQVIGPGDCNLTADDYSLNTEGGISIGGNQITGLGENGLAASAAELDAIAFGNSATTASGATGAVAIGSNASATLANGVALGAGSVENRGALSNYSAPGITGTVSSAGAVSIGASGSERQLTNVAPGTADSDAATVGQVSGSIALATADSVEYDDASHASVSLDGSGGTTITNVAAGTLDATSTDAVNGSQLFETNQNVATNTTNISNNTTAIAGNTTAIDALDDATVQYDDGSLATVTLEGTSGTTITNVTAGTLDATSTDAVNGSQLFETNQNVATNAANISTNTTAIAGNTTDISNLDTRVGTNETDIAALSDSAVQYDDGTYASVTLDGASGTTITNVAAGTLDALSTDAVNGSQLFETNQNVTANTTAIAGNTTDISNLDTRVSTNETDIAALSDSAVQYDDGTFASVTLDGASGTTITNVAAGTLDATSSDAVNGSQLFETNQNVATNAANISTNTTAIAGNTTDISNLDTRVSTNETDIAALSDSAVQYDDGTFASVTLDGASGTTITNVTAGTLDATSTDAVNGSQLFTTNQNVAINAANISTNSSDIADLDVRVGTSETDIAALDTRLSTSEGDILALDTRVTSNEGDIVTNTNAIAALDAASVQYDDGSFASVTLNGSGGTTITNVAAGTLDATSSDAVNGSQLFATNQNVTANATSISTNTTAIATNTADIANLDTRIGTNETDIAALSDSAVQYDDGTFGLITLSGSGGTTVTNVAAGTLDATSTDAVNGSQLFATNQNVTINATDIAALDVRVTTNESDVADNSSAIAALDASAVQYDDGTNATVTLSGAGGTRISNLADGAISAVSTDAITGSQLWDVTQTISALNDLAVQYDDVALAMVTFGGSGGTVLRNVAPGTLSGTSTDAVNGSQLFTTNQAVSQNTSDLSSLDARVTVNQGDIAALDSRVTVNEGDIAANTTAIAGNTTTIASLSASAVQYDDPGNSTVTLSGSGGTTVTNLADGALDATSSDAVTGAQLFATNQQVTQNTAAIAALGTGSGAGFAVSYTDGTLAEVALGGADGTVISNLAEGELSASSTEAVNGSQLFATNQAVTSLDGRVSVNETNIAGNTSAITTLQTTIGAQQTTIANYDNRITRNEGDIATLDGRVTVNEGDIAGLATRVTVNEGNIGVLDNRITTNAQNITSLDGRVTNNSKLITGVQAQIDNIPVGFVRDENPALRSPVPTNTAAYRGAGGNPVRVTNVAAGTLAANSTDAVNGGQLFATNEAVAANREDIDQNTSDIQALNNNIAGSTVVAVQYSHAETPTVSNGGTVTNHAAFVGADSDAPVAVHNVAAGVLPNDAVNVTQMQAGLNSVFSETLGYTDMRVAQVRFDLAETRAAAFAGTASALAVAGIPQTMDADKSMIGGGIGHYRGESAFAIGASSVLGDGKAIIKVGASINTTGHGSFSGGAGFAF